MSVRASALVAVVLQVSCAAGTGPSAHDAHVGHELGRRDARAELVIFGDYGCGPCAAWGRTVQRFIEGAERDLRLVYRHCPSSRHPAGRAAAITAAAASLQGRFWQVHWTFLEQGPVRDIAQVRPLLEAAGVDLAALEISIETGRPEDMVEADLRLADSLDVRGTPTSFIDGNRLEGAVSVEVLEAALGAGR